MTIYIIGAGPTGLATVDGLVDAGLSDDIVLFELGDQLGGLAKTIEWGAHGRHDLGPHKIFTLDKVLQQRVENLLEDSRWLERDKSSSVFMGDRFLPYPPSPFSLLGILGPIGFARACFDYGMALLQKPFRRRAATTFEEDIVHRLGYTLHKSLFAPIAEKLWGDPRELDVKLSKGRVQTPSLVEVVGRMLGIQKSSEFEALTFKYPIGGLSEIWSAIRAKAKDKVTFNLKHKISSLTVDDDRVTAMTVVNEDSGEEKVIEIGGDDFIVSTMPLGVTVSIFSTWLKPETVKAARDYVLLNDLLLIFLKIDEIRLLDESWVFIPDSNYIFHRVSEQTSFDPDMQTGGSIVCCEVMSNTTRPNADLSDAELIDRCVSDLRRMGYENFKVEDSKVMRLPRSYPVYKVGFEAPLSALTQSLDGLKNYKSVGRQGAFNYIGTLDAMDIGYGMADWLMSEDRSKWAEERERTNHYPVLD